MITIASLSDERQDALADLVSRYNELVETPLTGDQYLDLVCLNMIDAHVGVLYEAALKRLGDGARNLPYSSRQALIAQVEAQSNP